MTSMRRSGILLGLLAGATICTSAPARAETVTTQVTGSMGITHDTCLQGLTNAVGDGENCMYDGGPAANPQFVPIADPEEFTGPYNHMAYYDSVAKPEVFVPIPSGSGQTLYVPTVNDGKMAQDIDGSFTIDDGGDGFGTGDLIGFTLTLTSSGSGDIIRWVSSSVVDKYSSMTQTLAPRAADSATPNEAGGFDYVIGSEGFPTRLIFAGPGCVGALFGEVECGHSFAPGTTEPNFWSNSSTGVGIGSLESNLGAKTTGTVTDLQCIESISITTGVTTNDCKDSQVSYAPWVIGPCAATIGGCTGNESTPGSIRGAAEDVGWDQLLLKVSTDATGRVIAVEGYNVDDYRVFGATRCGDNLTGTGLYIDVCNSWTSSFFTLSAAAGGDALDDGPLFATEGFELDVPVAANDTGFTNPTVTIATAPTQGTAEVIVDPLVPGGVIVRYVANVGATGTDSLVYDISSGASNDSATVSFQIGAGANPDIATTGRNQPVVINVGANDPGFDDTVTITINDDFTNGGSAVVTEGNGGPASSILVTYTPVTPQGSPNYTETFTYTIDDGVLAPSTAQVSVRVANSAPGNLDRQMLLSTVGVAPLDLEGELILSGSSLGDAPSEVTLANGGQGTHGTAVYDPDTRTMTYTVTDAAFFEGTDTFTYTVEDNDGDTATGTITVSIAPATPALDPTYITVQQGKSSVPVEPKYLAGNGSPEQHTLEITGAATHGLCELNGEDGTAGIIYTPDDPGYTGGDSCQLTLEDANGDSSTAAVNINVTSTPEVGGASSAGPFGLLLLGLVALARGPVRRRRWRVAGTVAMTALLASGLAAQAQETGDAADDAAATTATPEAPPAPSGRSSAAVQEIVVTARKVEENLQEVPLAITAFDSAAIEAQGITNLQDVAQFTPGLSFFNAFGENLPVPVIRGIAPTDIFGQNNAAVFVDGVYISGREGLNFGLLDVERIEVVKGPQSALYGRNAFSGAINYVTKLPSEVFEARTTVEAGNRGKVRGAATLSGPLLGDNLRGRIAAQYDEWDGSYDNSVADTDIGGYRFRSIQGSLYWIPADDWTVSLSYYNSNDDIDEAATIGIPTNCEDRVGDNNSTPRLQNFCGEVPDIEDAFGQYGSEDIAKVAQATGEERDLDRANLKIEWDLHDYGSISSLTGYSNTQQASVSDFARNLGYSQPFLYCATASTEGDPASPNTCSSPADQRFFAGVYDRELGGETEEYSQELRYTSPQDQRLRFTAGGYWYTVNAKGYPGGPISTRTMEEIIATENGGNSIGLPPFDDSTPGSPPNFAIGTAIFYTTFTDDGGIDPLGRVVGESDTDGWAVFGGSDFDITDTLTARAELRYSQESQQETSYAYWGCPDRVGSAPECGDDEWDLRLVAPVRFLDENGNCDNNGDGQLEPLADCSRTGSARFDSVTGRVGLDWQFSDEWMVYGSVAYGEKPGGLQLATVRVVPPGQEPDDRFITNTFEPEELTAYELGLKGTIWDGRMVISSAVFYNDWKQIVLRQLVEVDPVSGDPLEQPTAFNVNAGDAGVLGFEVETNVGFTDNLSGRFTVGWADAELDNAAQDTFELFPTFAPDGDVSGNKLLRQPEWLLSASLNYQRELTGDWSWYTGADASYQSGIYIGNENQGWLPEHTYVNGKFGLRSGVYTIEVWGKNILDDDNAIAAFRDIYWANNDDLYAPYRNDSGARPNFDDFVPLRYSVTYPRERTYGLTFLMRFGGAVQ